MSQDPLVALENAGKFFARDGSSSPARLLARALWRRAPGPREFWAVRGAALALRPGERVAVLGPNGAGKSTLLRLLAGVIAPDEGRRMGGSCALVAAPSLRLDLALDGPEHLRLSLRLFGGARERDGRALALARRYGLEPAFQRPLGFWSSGERTRLALAAALASGSRVILLDETLSAADEGVWALMREDLLEFSRTGALAFSTHTAALARELGTRAALLRRGELMDSGRDVDEAWRRYRGLCAAEAADATR